MTAEEFRKRIDEWLGLPPPENSERTPRDVAPVSKKECPCDIRREMCEYHRD